MKDYVMRAKFIGYKFGEIFTVCAPTAIDAHSAVWPRLSDQQCQIVDTFEIVIIEACAHKKGRVV